MAGFGRDADTQLGGGERSFPTTSWSRLLGGFQGPEARRREALEELARLYWKPVYAYLRAKWSKSNEEAKDLVQDFFLWMIESGFLARADPARGRFRAFVKVALGNYLVDDDRREGRLKRGGDHTILALGGVKEDDALSIPDAAGKTPEQILDLTWKRELLLRAADLMERELKQEGKELCFRMFQEGYVNEAVAIDYRAMAARYGVSETDVFNGLRTARKAFKDAVTRLVAETVEGERELREELEGLFGGAAP